VVLDAQEKLHLLDVRAQDNLETLDMSRVGISYASSHFKGLSTGGNVSKVQGVISRREREMYLVIHLKYILHTGDGVNR
jgi:hypothetical protein